MLDSMSFFPAVVVRVGSNRIRDDVFVARAFSAFSVLIRVSCARGCCCCCCWCCHCFSGEMWLLASGRRAKDGGGGGAYTIQAIILAAQSSNRLKRRRRLIESALFCLFVLVFGFREAEWLKTVKKFKCAQKKIRKSQCVSKV